MLHSNCSLTRLPVQAAAAADEVDADAGCDTPSGGGPGEAGSIFFKVGLTVFFIHVATTELWFLTPSAATLTLSIMSPRQNHNRKTSQYDSRILSNIKSVLLCIHPFWISSSVGHLDACYVHLPNYGTNGCKYSYLNVM